MEHRHRIGLGTALVVAVVGAAVWLVQARGDDTSSLLVTSDGWTPAR